MTGNYARTVLFALLVLILVTLGVPIANADTSDMTTTVVVSNLNPSVFGQPVSLTATVTQATQSSGTPTGTVTFFDNGAGIGNVPIDDSGDATITINNLPAGSDSITATYNGDSGHSTSTADSLSQIVLQAQTATSISSNVSPSNHGQSVTLTAIVTNTTSDVGIPSGQVFFLSGDTLLGSATLNGGSPDQAIFPTTAIPVGTSSLTAVYSGDSNFASKSSAAISQTVSGPPITTIAVTNSPAISVTGQSVTLTAAVANGGSAATPTGTVTFFTQAAGAPTPTSIGTGTLDGTGSTSINASFTADGNPYQITVSYAGDSNNSASTSTAVTQTVDVGATTTTMSASPNPSGFNQSVTLTANLSVGAPSSGVPTGTVNFYIGAILPADLVATGTLTGTQASASTSALPTGADQITAVYSGDANFASSTSSAYTQNVSPAATVSATTTALSASPNPSIVGQSVTLTSTITPTPPGSGLPTGTVKFYNGSVSPANQIGTGAVSGGQASMATSSLSVGQSHITAVYSGDVNFNGSTSSSVTVTVNPGSVISATSTTLTTSPNPSGLGQSVTLSATVAASPPGSGSPTGTVKFYKGAITPANVIGTAAVSGGVASINKSNLPTGANSITAVYSGDANFSGSTSATVTQSVSAGNASIVLGSSINPALAGQSFVLTATVTGTTGLAKPTGTVAFVSGAAQLGTVNLNGQGIATLTTSDPAGTYSITGHYSGDGVYPSITSATLSETVNNGVASITQLLPESTVEGSQNTSITINGSGFVSGSVAMLNGVAIATTFVSSAQLIAIIPASDLARATGSTPLSITVANPAPGGGSSAAGSFAVNDASLHINGIPAINTSPLTGSALTANFSSGNPNAPASEFSATIDWGDGATTAGTITQNGGGSFGVAGTHTYSTAAIADGQSASFSPIVTVNEVGGATASATGSVTIAGPVATIPIGLSMVGLPYDYSNTTYDAATIFGLSPDPTHGNHIDLVTYIPSINNYVFYPNLPGVNALDPALTGFQTIPGQGYWILTFQSTPITLTGSTVPSPYTSSIEPGWNIVSDPFLQPVQTSSLTFTATTSVDGQPVGATLTLQQAEDGGLMPNHIYGYDQSANAYVVATSFQPFQAYWLYVDSGTAGNTNVGITYTAPTSP